VRRKDGNCWDCLGGGGGVQLWEQGGATSNGDPNRSRRVKENSKKGYSGRAILGEGVSLIFRKKENRGKEKESGCGFGGSNLLQQQE